MTPDLIISLPREVPLPQFRLFQRVRVHLGFIDEDEVVTGLVVGWRFITRSAITDNPKRGFYPRWLYAIQFDPGCRFTMSDPEFVEDTDILEIVDA